MRARETMTFRDDDDDDDDGRAAEARARDERLTQRARARVVAQHGVGDAHDG